MRSEMCSLHLTHPSGAVGSRLCSAGEQLGVWCLAQGSHLSRGHFLLELNFDRCDIHSSSPTALCFFSLDAIFHY